MLIIALTVIAAFGIMVVLGSSVLEGQNEKRHPPDDDGCRKEADDE